jgi:pimeloyl-ACP methyl ester carboxylesterase
MRRLSVLLFGVALLGLLHGPVFGQAKPDPGKEKKAVLAAPPVVCAPTVSFQHLGCRPIVFVVNGEAGSTHASDVLCDLNSDCNLGLRIQVVNWTRHDSHSKDVVDCDAQLNAAARIACTVRAIHKDVPNAPIFFVGHSGGAHVVLRAAEMLPAGSVDRIIVLAPAVSCSYDLTRALKTSRGGIDNFFSSEDSLLEHMSEHVGNADGGRGRPAGIAGFRLYSNDPKDIAAYCNVRQYKWDVSYCGSGGHYTWTRYHNLKKTVAPMFSSPVPIYDGPAVAVKTMPPAK